MDRGVACVWALASRDNPCEMKHFKRTPLQSRTTEIRLSSVEETEDLDDIRWPLTTELLDPNPFYLAVSYELEPQIDIYVDGKAFRVGHNLWLPYSRLPLLERDKRDNGEEEREIQTLHHLALQVFCYMPRRHRLDRHIAPPHRHLSKLPVHECLCTQIVYPGTQYHDC